MGVASSRAPPGSLALGLRGSPSSPKVSWDGMSAVGGVYRGTRPMWVPHPHS